MARGRRFRDEAVIVEPRAEVVEGEVLEEGISGEEGTEPGKVSATPMPEATPGEEEAAVELVVEAAPVPEVPLTAEQVAVRELRGLCEKAKGGRGLGLEDVQAALKEVEATELSSRA